jgi:hypothetical protein
VNGYHSPPPYTPPPARGGSQSSPGSAPPGEDASPGAGPGPMALHLPRPGRGVFFLPKLTTPLGGPARGRPKALYQRKEARAQSALKMKNRRRFA